MLCCTTPAAMQPFHSESVTLVTHARPISIPRKALDAGINREKHTGACVSGQGCIIGHPHPPPSPLHPSLEHIRCFGAAVMTLMFLPLCKTW